jgi:DTW domain-containing protein YfiP
MGYFWGVFLGPPERVATEVLTRLVKGYPSDEAVFRGVHQSMEIRDVFSKFTPMRKDIILSDAFWIEYRRVHKKKPSMARQPKRIMIRKSKPAAVIKAKPSMLKAKQHRISKPTLKRP